MATITNADLTLTTVDDKVTIDVSYDATFTAFERQLAGLGKTYHAHFDVHGVDNGTDIGPTIVSLTTQSLPVTAGTTGQTLSKTHSGTFARADLQEDPDKGNADELKVNIRIHSPDVLPEFTDDLFTDQEVLLG